jgi:hypothetical protein
MWSDTYTWQHWLGVSSENVARAVGCRAEPSTHLVQHKFQWSIEKNNLADSFEEYGNSDWDEVYLEKARKRSEVHDCLRRVVISRSICYRLTLLFIIMLEWRLPFRTAMTKKFFLNAPLSLEVRGRLTVFTKSRKQILTKISSMAHSSWPARLNS